jgi:hypothetical protein
MVYGEGSGEVVSADDVGISLMAGEEANAISEILRDALGDGLRVSDCTTYLKLETESGSLEIHFEDVGEKLGRPFTLSDFQLVFASYYGRPCVRDDMIGVYSSMTVGVSDDI